MKQNYVERKKDGKHIFMYLTESGKALCENIYHCLEQIYLQHAQILDKDHSDQLIIYFMRQVKILINLIDRKMNYDINE